MMMHEHTGDGQLAHSSEADSGSFELLHGLCRCVHNNLEGLHLSIHKVSHSPAHFTHTPLVGALERATHTEDFKICWTNIRKSKAIR